MKNKILKVGSVALGIVGFVVSALGAGAAITTLIPVASSTLLADLASYTGILFTDLLPLIAIVAGVIFAFWIINKAMNIVARRAKS